MTSDRPVSGTLHHLTSTTGHLTRTSRSKVADDVIELLRPIVEAEGGQVPFTPEWHLDVWRLLEDGEPKPGAAVFQVARGPASSDAGKRPYVMAVACWREELSAEAWQQAHQIADMAPPNNLPGEVPPVPWLAVTMMPAIMLLPRERVLQIGDLERCVFWTLVEAAP